MYNSDRTRVGIALVLTLVGGLLISSVTQAAPVSWAVNANGDWGTASNWSSNPLLPSSADDVTIDVGGATVRTITVSSAVPIINGLVSQENLDLSGGNLNIGAGGGLINGTLSIAPNMGLRVTQGTFAVNGTTNINSGNLDVQSAGTLNLPALTSYASTVSPTWQAGGAGSTLTANALTTIDATAGYLQTYANDGGHLNFNGLTTVNAANGYYVRFHADGAGSSISIPNVTSVQSVAFDIWNSGSITTSQTTSAQRSSIDVRSASPNFNAVTNLNGSSVYVSTAATLTFPGVTTYSSINNGAFTSDGTGTTLSLNALTTIDATAGHVQFYANGGSHLNLNALTTVSSANGYYVRYRADGAGSSLSFPTITSIVGAAIDIFNSGSMTTSQLNSLTNSTIDVRTATPNFNAITNLNGSSVSASAAGTVTFPAVSSYSSVNNGLLSADGSGTTVSLSALTTVNATAGGVQFYATGGGS